MEPHAPYLAQHLNLTSVLAHPNGTDPILAKLRAYPLVLGWPGALFPLVFGALQVGACFMLPAVRRYCCCCCFNRHERPQGRFYVLFVLVSLLMEVAKIGWLFGVEVPKNPTPLGEPALMHVLVLVTNSVHNFFLVVIYKLFDAPAKSAKPSSDEEGLIQPRPSTNTNSPTALEWLLFGISAIAFLALLPLMISLAVVTMLQLPDAEWSSSRSNRNLLIAVNSVFIAIFPFIVVRTVWYRKVKPLDMLILFFAPFLIPLGVSAAHDVWPTLEQVVEAKSDALTANMLTGTHVVAAVVAFTLDVLLAMLRCC
ncbi:hypothetical protein H9P43_005755 [Blastocladiella emersonii ATCC 22665]|nr:hypothetical protein H9P43_005755 [Blastocladiella emersonii ATCC 22665]